MIRFPFKSLLFYSLFWSIVSAWSGAAIVINELMVRPPGTPEATNLEFIELRNTATTAVDISYAHFDKGITFAFPVDSYIPASGYVVVVADVAAFKAEHPTVPNDAIYGPWTGTLANNGGTLRLVSEIGILITSMKYGSEGEWANRVRSAADSGQQGWEWANPADGTGKSWELKNETMELSEGQNWAGSVPVGGTPGFQNSTKETNSAPFILEVKHTPAIPKPTDVVTIEAQLLDTPDVTATGTVFWRVSNSSPGTFAQAAMVRVGTSTTYKAVLPAQPNLTVVEFYISSTDGFLTRTWPPPNNLGQTTNCLYQVDSEALPAGTPVYRVVMSVPEYAQFTTMTTHTDAAMNCTFIGDDGSGPSIRYRADVRYRGASSRDFSPAPNRINVPSDRPYNGSSKMNINSKYTYLQFIGMKLMYASGIRAPDTKRILLRRNGVNPMSNTAVENYGYYAHLEPLGSEFVDNHYPDDNKGNLYKKVRPDNGWAYRSGSVATYIADGWIKESNSAASDWSQLDNFLKVMNQAAGPTYLAQVQAVADLDQWARWFAVETILTNGETNASNGADDDYSLYFSGVDQKAHFVPHDFDTILGQGDSSKITDPNRTLFDMTENADTLGPLTALFGTTAGGGNATFRTMYFTALRDLCLSSFSQVRFDALLDNYLTGWVPASKITELKTFMNSRRSYVLSQCSIALGTPTPTIPGATYTATVTAPVKPLQLSEVMAKNVTAYDEGGTFPDYVELQNTSAADIYLDGMRLTNAATSTGGLVFPTDTILAPGGYLLVRGGTTATGLSLGFGLDQDGGTLRLFGTAGALLDTISWGPQVADKSISRTGTAPTTWALTLPSPGTANGDALALADPNGLKFNEWLSLPKNRYDRDFVEIYNSATNPAPLGRLRVTDDLINYPNVHQFPALSFMPAQGFYVLQARDTGATPENWSELPFGLAAHQDWLNLLGENGVVIDQFNVLCQPPDLPQGRSPDGAAALVNFTLPTPGLTNATAAKIAADTTYANALALMNGLRITEIMYNPGVALNSQQEEFVELRNMGSVPLQLEGLRFTKGLTFTFPNYTLAPGAYALVIANQAAFEAKYGTSLPVVGVTSSVLSNSGERITLTLPEPFLTSVQTFVFNDKWYPETDGLGRSLSIVDATAPLAMWDVKDGWTASVLAGGTPGTAGPPQITSALTAGGTQGASFSYQVLAANQPTSYAADGLPSGLNINTTTGLIYGVPDTVGATTAQISATNSAGTDTKSLVITINLPPAPVISSALSVGATLTAPFYYVFTATNNPTSLTVSNLPSWLSYSNLTHSLSGQATVTGTYNVTLTASNGGGSDTKTLVINVANDPFASALDGLGLSYVTGGTANWFVQTTDTHDGLDAMQSGDIGDSKESWLEAVVTGPDRLTFWWKVSSESSYDYLNLNVDGTTVQSISGSVDWTQILYDIPAGTHTVRWVYRKDGSVTTGTDSGYLDEVRLASQTVEPVIISPLTAVAYQGQPFSYQVVATHDPTSYGATGLPEGLYINTITGEISGTPTGSGGTFLVNVTARGPTGIGSTGLTISITSTPEAIAAALDGPGITYRRGGDSQWFAQTTVTHDGVDAARSGNIGPSQQSWMEIDVTGPDRVTFWWKVSSYQYEGYLSYMLDGSTYANLTGEQDWQQVAVEIPAGVHTLRWRYWRYSYNSTSGLNAGFVDQVIVASQTPTPTILSPLTAGGYIGQPFTYQISATKNPTSFATSTLPAGLELDPVTGVISGTPTTPIIMPVTVSATGESGTGSDVVQFNISVSDAAILAALDLPADTPVTRTGNLPWSAQTTVTHDGVDAALAPSMTAAGSSMLSVTLPGPDRISFWWRPSMSSNDYAYFRLNGNYNQYIYGEANWARVVVDLPNATNTVAWQLFKEGTAVAGANTLYVDEVRQASQVPMITSPLFANAIAGQSFSYQITSSFNPTSYSVANLPAGLTVNAQGLISGITTQKGTFTLTLNVTTPSGPASETLSLTVGSNPSLLVIGGDAQNLTYGQNSSSGATYNGWFTQYAVNHDGADALQSGPIPHYGYSRFYLYLDGPGTLSFWWRTSSESGGDYLNVRDENYNFQDSISGETSWAQKTYTITGQNSHTITFSYEKDYQTVAGADAGFVDQIVWVPEDLDADGLSDAWERRYFPDYSANATDDQDGDGQTNAKEAVAGTSPLSSASVLKIIGSSVNPDKSVRLVWNSVPGHSYAVQSSPDLTNWTTYPTRYYAATNQTEATVKPVGSLSSVTFVAGNAQAYALVPSSSTNNTLWRGGDEAGFLSGGGITGWLSGVQGVGYETDNVASGSNVPYTPYIGINVQSQMYNVRGSVFIRIPFSISNASLVRTLSMQIRYDDGFVAFLNGTQVAGDNSPNSLAYNSLAPNSRNDTAASVYRTIDLTASTSLLKTGTNIFAIHGLNNTTGSSDMLIQTVLSGTAYNAGTANPVKLYWRVVTQ